MNAAHVLLFGAKNGDGTHERHPLRAVRGSESADVLSSIQASYHDDPLIARIRAGETAAFEILYRTHVAALTGFANSFLHVQAIAEDVVSDVFVRLWEIRETFCPVTGIRAYLFAAVRNRTLDHLRSERRAEQRHRTSTLDMAYESPVDESLERTETLAAVQRVIDTFPPLRRQILDLRLGQGLGNAEIATVVGLTDQAVRSHISRALRDLRRAFPGLIQE